MLWFEFLSCVLHEKDTVEYITKIYFYDVDTCPSTPFGQHVVIADTLIFNSAIVVVVLFGFFLITCISFCFQCDMLCVLLCRCIISRSVKFWFLVCSPSVRSFSKDHHKYSQVCLSLGSLRSFYHDVRSKNR